MKDNLLIFGQHDAGTLAQILVCAQTGERAVLCADGHKGYTQPIGGVVAYRDKVSISGVGFDIGCGNLAIRTTLRGSDVEPHIHDIMRSVVNRISFGVGKNNEHDAVTPRIMEEFLNDDRWNVPAIHHMKRKAELQLGTVGSGNHYVDIFVDKEDYVWVGVHFGSRGFGHGTATAFLKAAGGKDGMDVPPTIVDDNSELGKDYIAAMGLAGYYARIGRTHVALTVAENILGATVFDSVHSHHNFAWREEHGGEMFWVVRKGATPAFPGQRGFIGGSMGDDAVIIEGVDSDLSRQALYSTVHGAGRIMSRTAARGKFVKDENGKKQRQPGLVRHDEWQEWLRRKRVVVLGGDLDEAPQAYRRLPEVLQAHEGTIRILHTLRPIGVAMAGKDEIDPYKD